MRTNGAGRMRLGRARVEGAGRTLALVVVVVVVPAAPFGSEGAWSRLEGLLGQELDSCFLVSGPAHAQVVMVGDRAVGKTWCVMGSRGSGRDLPRPASPPVRAQLVGWGET